MQLDIAAEIENPFNGRLNKGREMNGGHGYGFFQLVKLLLFS
jgi:hypothetical protein